MENPEWLEELRRMLLTQELLELLKKFENFRQKVEERFDTLEKILSFFSEYLLDAKAIDQEKINKDLSLAMKKGIISREERVDVLRLDLIIKGTLLNTEGPVLVAVEVSHTIDDFDVRRTINRAKILEKATDKRVLPAVVGYEITKKAQDLMEKEGVIRGVFSE